MTNTQFIVLVIVAAIVSMEITRLIKKPTTEQDTVLKSIVASIGIADKTGRAVVIRFDRTGPIIVYGESVNEKQEE